MNQELRVDEVSAAGLLESRRAEILRHLERRLRETGNRLGKDPVVLPTCIARADAILTATVSELDGAGPEVAQVAEPAAGIGGTGLLMDVVLDELLRVGAERPERVGELSAVLTSLHRNLASQVHASGDSFDSYILRTADEARRKERRHLAQEVHDELGHELSIAKHQLELSELYQATNQLAAADRVTSAREHLDSAMSIVRRLIVEFAETRSGMDLEKEIVSFADAAGGRHTAVHVRVGNQLLMPDSHRHQLFLIVREALLNVFAHAGADKAIVLVDTTTEAVTVVVEDNGDGFDPTESADRRGFGLVSMRERAQSLGGEAVVSSSSAGTRVEVWLPLP
jgi:signal transduction histidine kinase